jgi:hypothetical protein
MKMWKFVNAFKVNTNSFVRDSFAGRVGEGGKQRQIGNLANWKIGIVLLLSLAFACSYPEGYERVEVDGKYSLDVPAFLKETEDIALDATLQYENPYRNLYIIVMEDDKRSSGMDFEAYHKMAVGRITEDPLLEEPTIEDEEEKMVNGLRAIETSIFGTMDEKEIIFYKHMTVDGEETYYQVVIWLRGEKRRLEYEETIDSVMRSFREL